MSLYSVPLFNQLLSTGYSEFLTEIEKQNDADKLDIEWVELKLSKYKDLIGRLEKRILELSTQIEKSKDDHLDRELEMGRDGIVNPYDDVLQKHKRKIEVNESVKTMVSDQKNYTAKLIDTLASISPDSYSITINTSTKDSDESVLIFRSDKAFLLKLLLLLKKHKYLKASPKGLERIFTITSFLNDSSSVSNEAELIEELISDSDNSADKFVWIQRIARFSELLHWLVDNNHVDSITDQMKFVAAISGAVNFDQATTGSAAIESLRKSFFNSRTFNMHKDLKAILEEEMKA